MGKQTQKMLMAAMAVILSITAKADLFGAMQSKHSERNDAAVIVVVPPAQLAVQPVQGEINVRRVEYGNWKVTCDGTYRVKQACDMETSCSIRVSNDVCGIDPAPGAKKSIRVVYSCGDGTRNEEFGWEGQIMTFSCKGVR